MGWNVTAEAYARAEADPLAFWAQAADRLQWDTPWREVLDWTPPAPSATPTTPTTPPAARWFTGGRLNATTNCVDRHVAAGLGAKVAIHWEGEDGERRTVTYADLQQQVARAAHALSALGVTAGDRIVIYLPVLVETVVATLAAFRIGAVASLVFGGFSAEAVRFRIADTGAKVLVTSDGQYRRGAAVPVKQAADEAAEGLVDHVLVVRRTGDIPRSEVPWTPGRDVWWHEALAAAPADAADHAPLSVDAEHPLFIVYTSGTTGRPKGLVHTTGGYLTHAGWAHWAHFDAKPTDVHWCTADLAWVTAHTYAIVGPLLNGLTEVLYEGTPDTPHRERHLEIIQRYGVTTYYTAPTLLRTLHSWFGEDLPAGYDLSSLRLLGTVGEAINPETWRWFQRAFSAQASAPLPIIDTWWQSETGAAMVAPLPGVTALKPGSATHPLPGIAVEVVDDDGAPVPAGTPGTLVVTRPWPGMARTVWGDPQRYVEAYWSRYAGHGPWGGYFVAGDGAMRDADGHLWLLGRLDEVVNVSGHRLSTIEIESALVAHPAVTEAGATGVPDPLTGQAVAVFVVPTRQPPARDLAAWAALEGELREELRCAVARGIGPIAKPAHVVLVPEVPRTRSGKILRRLLAQLHAGAELGDTTSLQNPWAVARIAAALDHEEAA
ncbi:acetate--CoA ligase [Serinibacter salmoneus]|uniref:Acetate--CoA ligase n=1 Tax=Serinibacter salmoneus TaxID=556530 RepID=A0A2A9D335_9MICO|nr:acetate--CoA ligase [Serinibacter salmoneus]PFG21117.1 acetyl-coenzyme A synthetase [Serinibacter salmoneus]